MKKSLIRLNSTLKVQRSMFKVLSVLCILSVLSVVNSSAATYQGKPLSEKRFNQFYAYFKTRLFTDSTGKVHDLSDPAAKATLSRDAAKGDSGAVVATVSIAKPDAKAVAIVTEEYQEEVSQLAADNHLRKGPPVFVKVKVDRVRAWPCCLSGAALRQGERFTGLAVMDGTWYDNDGKRGLPLLRVLTPVKADQFAAYIEKNQLCYYKKIVTPARYQTCKKCNGFGQVKKNHKSLDYEKCPDCHGKRKLETSPAKVDYVKKEIK